MGALSDPFPSIEIRDAIKKADGYVAWAEAAVLLNPCPECGESGILPPKELLLETNILEDIKHPFPDIKRCYRSYTEYCLERLK